MRVFAPALLVLAAHSVGAQPATAVRGAPAVRSAAISDVRYQLSFNAARGLQRSIGVQMTFAVTGREPVLLSLPAWTPGAYEISNYARFVSAFAATAAGRPLRW